MSRVRPRALPVAIAALVALLATAAPEAHAMRGKEPPASATHSCGPSGGPAITLSFELAGGSTVRASVWGDALRRMRADRVTLALGASASDLGVATICPAKARGAGGQAPCRPLTARLVLDVGGTETGDVLRGRLHYQEARQAQQVIPFSVELRQPPGGRPVCR